MSIASKAVFPSKNLNPRIDKGERKIMSGENVGECLEMSSKKILWAATAVGGGPGGGKKRYISYEALRRDNVPSNRLGKPYYNCHALPKANPYTRGCSVITGSGSSRRQPHQGSVQPQRTMHFPSPRC
ncbi:uncharacterized protein LOC109844693 isoform X3 [Asparagus officinalis]|uniref:uncharacterized protein LOC109844693 isoform X3 n=1 Tax=Asparagus officinalis TaxID=4686 RepID=UPI00098E1DBD|nr:uncharacterized protein LOC109844693 isoform X3 [Asparagus officinalis]